MIGYLRDRRGGYRRLSERIRLYDEARRLQGLGLSRARIGRTLGVAQSQIGDWLVRGVRPRRDRYDPDLAPGPDLSYLIGFWLGDGRNAGQQKKVRFKLADKEQILHVNRILARLLGREPKPILMDGTFYTIDYDTSVLYDYISQPLKRLEQCIQFFKADFLRGFFDAEGYVSCYVDASGKRLGGLIIGAANTNLEYLRIVRNHLARLGIKSSIRRTNRRGESMTIRGNTWVRKHDVCHLIIRRQGSIKKFFVRVGFRNRAKQGKLGDLISLLSLPQRQRYDWFVNHYAKRGRRWYKTA
ncbi:MAG: hypothetical protein LYZ70_00395 [Nitrososphaerales archaeon]|nr:hypothetical protein [Nitrososphaerales archaeon]